MARFSFNGAGADQSNVNFRGIQPYQPPASRPIGGAYRGSPAPPIPNNTTDATRKPEPLDPQRILAQILANKSHGDLHRDGGESSNNSSSSRTGISSRIRRSSIENCDMATIQSEYENVQRPPVRLPTDESSGDPAVSGRRQRGRLGRQESRYTSGNELCTKITSPTRIQCVCVRD